MTRARRRAQAGLDRVRDVKGILSAGGKRIAELEAAVVQSSAAIESLTSQVRQMEAIIQGLGAERCANMMLPFTERAQALKMLREGRPARQIASTLGVAQGEILLLTRMQEAQDSRALMRQRSQRESDEALALKALRQIANGMGETA